MNTLAILLSLLSLQSLDWTVGWSNDKDTAPTKYVTATVPGSVQKDIADAENYPDYKFDDNYKLFSWMEDVYFTYRTEFKAPKHKSDERVYFCSKGIDYEFDIRLNGELLLHQEGMFTPVKIDLTERLKGNNLLEVIIYKAPKWRDTPVDRSQAAHSVKPPVSYGWDWHPRLIVSGIWDETGLCVKKDLHFLSQEMNYVLSEDMKHADITLSSTLSKSGSATIEWTLEDADGKIVASASGKAGEGIATTLKAKLDSPRLWWTHDYGEPYLYSSTFVLRDRNGNILDKKDSKVGFRRIRLIRNEDTSNEPEGFPKSRYSAPAQYELNGLKIFAKGTNWLAPDIFVGTIKADDYDKLLDMAKAANFNMLRCWGGCAVSKDAFFELCDKKGILVWQEFPLSCNDYPDEPHYLEVLRQEASSIVERIHSHPCIALFCGGNELFNGWSGMDDQSLPLRLLNSICYEKAPEIPFNYTSPLTGMGHGSYVFRMDGETVFDWMGRSHNTAYTEFGMPGLSDMNTLESIIPQKDMFPPKPKTSWETHHAFYSWNAENTWLDVETLALYFGQAADMKELVKQSQLLQCEGYKYIYEEARRKKPYCAMALNWCFNEPWPAACNNSLIVWPDLPKPALHAVGASCRPLCASARVEKYQWQKNELFRCTLWVLNDSYGNLPSDLSLSASIVTEDGQKIRLSGTDDAAKNWKTGALKANTNLAGPEFSGRIPQCEGRTFRLLIEVAGHPELGSEYVYSIEK